MRTWIGGCWFEGPWDYTPCGLACVGRSAGVYVVLCRSGESRRVLDLGGCADLRACLESHPRTACWLRHCGEGTLAVAVRSVEEKSGRDELVEALRRSLDPPCTDAGAG